MRALPWLVSVTIPACEPVNETALAAEVVDRHRDERDRDPLAGGQQHVVLARMRVGRDLRGRARSAGRSCRPSPRRRRRPGCPPAAVSNDAPRDALDLLGPATDVPPYFWTMTLTAAETYRPVAPGSFGGVIRDEIAGMWAWEERHQRLIARMIVAGGADARRRPGRHAAHLAVRAARAEDGDPHARRRALLHDGAAADRLVAAPNPFTTAGRVVDVFLEIWALFVVTAVAGSFAAFFSSRELATPREQAEPGVRVRVQRPQRRRQLAEAQQLAGDLPPPRARPGPRRTRAAAGAGRRARTPRRTPTSCARAR